MNTATISSKKQTEANSPLATDLEPLEELSKVAEEDANMFVGREISPFKIAAAKATVETACGPDDDDEDQFARRPEEATGDGTSSEGDSEMAEKLI